MGMAIAFMSGKGGSGKTTLSLTIANLLSDCGLKVLLIDCDLLTNGATYFYENRVGGKSLLNFYSVLYADNTEEQIPVTITPNLDFIPSVQRITKKITSLRPYKPEIFERFRLRIEELKERYEVLIFDCSSGYSDIVRCVAPLMDQNLIVLEADAISMSAMRGLYLKLSTHLPDVAFYQMFNKVREDMVERYMKEDTIFFPNIGAIAFDWAIPDAFSHAIVPTIANTSIGFGMQLYTICGRLFKGDRFQERLQRFHAQLMLTRARTERNQLTKELREYKPQLQNGREIIETTSQFLLSFVPALVLIYFMTTQINMELRDTITLCILVSVLVMPNLFYIMSRQRQNEELRRAKLTAYSGRLRELDDMIYKLENEFQKLASEDNEDSVDNN